MLLLHILSAASALFVSGHAAQARQSLLAATIASCRDVQPGPSVDCKLYIKDPTTGDLRSTLLSFPSTWSSDQGDSNPHPLILSFHGRGKNSSEQQLLTGFSDNTINAIAAYPQGKMVRHYAKTLKRSSLMKNRTSGRAIRVPLVMMSLLSHR